jgi:hypothetical protein
MEILIYEHLTGELITDIADKAKLELLCNLYLGYIPKPENIIPLAEKEYMAQYEHGTCLMGLRMGVYFIEISNTY